MPRGIYTRTEKHNKINSESHMGQNQSEATKLKRKNSCINFFKFHPEIVKDRNKKIRSCWTDIKRKEFSEKMKKIRLESPNYHAELTEEIKLKIKENTKLAMSNPTIREKCRLSKLNKKLSIEHRKAIGNVVSLQHKMGLRKESYIKAGNSNRGKKRSEEACKNIKAARAKQIVPMRDTSIELKIQSYLKLLHIEFLTHYYISEITRSYQCDIFIPSLKLIIECDGCYWHGCPICNKNISEFQQKQIEEDNIRTKELKEKNYKVLRLFEHDIKKLELNEFNEKLNSVK